MTLFKVGHSVLFTEHNVPALHVGLGSHKQLAAAGCNLALAATLFGRHCHAQRPSCRSGLGPAPAPAGGPASGHNTEIA